MNQKKNINILHINGDHYLDGKQSMKIYHNLVSEISKYINLNVIDMNDMQLNNLNNCKGCKFCFKTGKCIFEDVDDILEIKEKMKKSELLVISTPVFVDNIPGNLKTFFDRLSFWYHTMPLKGRSCIIIISTYSSGIDEVSKYLYKICSFLGLEVLGIVSRKKQNKKENIEVKVEMVCELLVDWLVNKRVTSSYVKKIYRIYDANYQKLMNFNVDNYEAQFWRETHL